MSFLSLRGCVVALALIIPIQLFGQDDELERHRDRLIARLESLQSLTAEFTLDTVFAPPGQGGAARMTVPNRGLAMAGLYVEKVKFRLAGGTVRYEAEYAPETVARLEQENHPFVLGRTVVLGPDGVESLTRQGTGGRAAVTRKDAGIRPPDDYLLDVAIGLRCLGDRVWLNKKRLRDALITMAAGRVTLQVAAGNGTVVHLWEFDPTKSYAVMTYRVKSSGNGFVGLEAISSAFVRHAGTLLPTSIQAKTSYPNSPPVRTQTIRALTYSVDPPTGTINDRTAWPAQALAADERPDVTMGVTTTRPTADEEIYRRARELNAAVQPSGTLIHSPLLWLTVGLVGSGLAARWWYRRARGDGKLEEPV